MVSKRGILVGILLFTGAGLALSASASQSLKSIQWVRGIYVAESPTASPVSASIAESVARDRAREVGGVAVPATGSSMMPLYQSGVIMVIAPVKYHELKRGQTVVYENRRGLTVAHILVTKLKTGWRVTGLNNRLHDGEGVNDANLRGVVVDAFQPVRGMSVASR